MADITNCQFLGGWNNLTDLTNNFSFSPSDEVFFLALKKEEASVGMTGLLVFQQYGYYAIVIRDYTYDYDTQAPFNPNYMSKNDVVNWFNSPSGVGYLSSLTVEQKELFFETLDNN